MSRMLEQELVVMKRRKVPDTDPRVVAIKRTLQKQEPEQVQRERSSVPFPQVINSQRRKIK